MLKRCLRYLSTGRFFFHIYSRNFLAWLGQLNLLRPMQGFCNLFAFGIGRTHIYLPKSSLKNLNLPSCLFLVVCWFHFILMTFLSSGIWNHFVKWRYEHSFVIMRSPLRQVLAAEENIHLLQKCCKMELNKTHVKLLGICWGFALFLKMSRDFSVLVNQVQSPT